MTRRALIVMAKQPVAGQTKTRLSPPLSPIKAAELYSCLLLDTLEAVRDAARQLSLRQFIAFHPSQSQRDFRALAPDFQLLAQQGHNLSERLARALLFVQEQGYDQVTAINSDSPALPVSFLIQAYRELDDPGKDIVLGPCDDGGYYLIGWKRPFPNLVRDVTMSTPTVLTDTMVLAKGAGLQVAILPPWYDVDDASALYRLQANGHAGKHVGEFIRQSQIDLSDDDQTRAGS
jgi:rSAM/selenodomain-associated transferase 1